MQYETCNNVYPRRVQLLTEFDSGRSHLILYLVLKLSHVADDPWCLFQLGCSNKDMVDAALDKLLRSRHPHPKVRLLQRQPLRAQAEKWLASPQAAIFDPDMLELCVFVAELKFASLSERPVEAVHSGVHRRGLPARRHSVAFQSFHMRFPELREDVQLQGKLLMELPKLWRHVKNFKQCSSSLGLGMHPTLAREYRLNRWDRAPVHSKVIYHADGYTLYRSPEPLVEVDGPGGGEDDDDDDGDNGGDGEDIDGSDVDEHDAHGGDGDGGGDSDGNDRGDGGDGPPRPRCRAPSATHDFESPPLPPPPSSDPAPVHTAVTASHCAAAAVAARKCAGSTPVRACDVPAMTAKDAIMFRKLEGPSGPLHA